MSEGRRQYVGNGKEFGNYGSIKIGIKVAELKPNAAGYVNLVVGRNKDGKNQYGNTHYVFVDDYVPPNREGSSPQPRQQQSQTPAQPAKSATDDPDLPF